MHNIVVLGFQLNPDGSMKDELIINVILSFRSINHGYIFSVHGCNNVLDMGYILSETTLKPP